MDNVALYRHRQIGWTMLLSGLAVLALMLALTHWQLTSRIDAKASAGFAPLLYAALLVPGFVIVVFSSLEVSVDQTQLRLRFGPGLVRKTFAIADIDHVKVARTSLGQGFGIHRRHGVTTYNVSGFDAVRVDFKNGSAVMIGTSEATRLAATLQRLIAVRK